MAKVKFLDKISIIADWIVKIIQINIMFILFSALGLLIFGIGPAYYASNIIFNKWREGEKPELFNTYFQIFKEKIIETSIITIMYLLLLLIIIFNTYSFFEDFLESFIRSIGILANIFLFLLLTTTYMTYPTIKDKYELKTIDALKYSFKLPWSIPLTLLLTYLLLVINFIGIIIIPQIFIFIFLGLFIFIGNNLAYRLYKKIEGVNLEEGEENE